ncbi:hemerythrin domain-containing protein [Basilea psittacipulmonis]|uniref:Hemerythrin-like domain-containing protein n=1 Tax=Basilea psittacipulmonis DSM 24701 TaxID=1072685 RepID=A0A077DHJ9_9BURK|nr:hemerythrin domain-containing protein [Basilea psittacipulmonis]AIL33037.1 hypothetical protein IX83_06680 [Basilea psittacipulmonis DSM 24701]
MNQDNQKWVTESDQATIEHILSRFHDVHRQQLDEIMALAQSDAVVDKLPNGLIPLLQHIHMDLLNHMMKEEQVLFPMILAGAGARASMPITVMKHEHADHESALTQLDELTHHFTVSDSSCTELKNLYQLLATFSQDLKQHIDLENNVLFERTLNKH